MDFYTTLTNLPQRGLLDLIIARIPGIGSRSKSFLCKTFSVESEFCRLSWYEIKNICREALQKDKVNDENQATLFNLEPVPRSKPNDSAFYSKSKPFFSIKTDKNDIDIENCRLQAEKDRVFMERHGIGYVSIIENEYPSLLKEIFDPPAVLFYRGNLTKDTKNTAAIVGTRKPHSAAAAFCYRIAYALGAAGVPVVSGLAIGIDAMAHRGNLEGGAASDPRAKTFAVLGSSVDCVYPAANRLLARRIVDGGGALLSEYPPQTQPQVWTFPARNRIIAGLSPFTLVVEAGIKSGALITADFALSEGRDLAVAADENGNAFGEGCEKLASDGAKKIITVEDILRELGIAAPQSTAHTADKTHSLSEQLAKELGIHTGKFSSDI
ncbi:MAG: hypothetical protein Ta2B_12420 [Termitinemataceae bacterium]|nr:MAG: hypothetical protein Ta2B_12420 [Termitinemataceae bacterium]